MATATYAALSLLKIALELVKKASFCLCNNDVGAKVCRKLYRSFVFKKPYLTFDYAENFILF